MIDHTDVSIQSPTLSLESYDPSPLLHMKLQSECITELAARFGAPKNVTTPAEIQEYKAIIEEWMQSFPAVYDINKPDFSRDSKHPWVTSHRFYIHTMAYLMVLNPIRTYMAKSFNKSSPADELKIREDGVYYSIRNLETTTQWTQYASHRDGRYHFIIFSLFDTASVLCAAIIKDEDLSIPRRDECLAGIENAVATLRRINSLSKTAKTSYDILTRLVRRLPRSSQGSSRKRVRRVEPTATVQQAPSSKSAESPQVQGYASESSPSNFASSVTASSSPQSNLGGENYSTPDSAAPSIDASISSFGVPLHETMPQAGMGMEGYYHQEPPMAPADPSLLGQPPIYQNLAPPVPEMVPGFGNFEPITDAELGEFNRLWDWQSLDLDFISSEAVAAQMMQQ